MSTTPRLIVGLGNPGPDYAGHRHNVGFQVLDVVAAQAGVAFSSHKFDGEFGQGSHKGLKLFLLKPQTFMNLSGQAGAAAARFFKVPAQDTLVIHDELDLPFARLQLKQGGGSGGHNGLKSIVEYSGED